MSSARNGAQSTFTHRHKTNGTVDSVCLACFGTVGTKLSEMELLNAEEQHRCEAPDLFEDKIENALRTSRACVRSTALLIQDSKVSMAHTRELIRNSQARFGKHS